MHKKNLFAALTAALAIFATPAFAQTTPSAGQETEWSDTSVVVITAHITGPAMWKLTKGDSTVWVLALLTVRPEPLEWNSGRFRRVLKGSNALIMPYLRAWDLPSERAMQLPGRIELQDVIGPSTYRRFGKRVEKEGFTAAQYDGYKPVWAAVMLTSDVFYKHALWDDLVPAYIPVMAREYEVPIKSVERKTADTMTALYARMNSAKSEACLVDYLDSIDYDLDVMPVVAKAWASGDLATVMREYREPGLVKCIYDDPQSAAAYKAYAIDDMVTAIDQAFKTPGKSVAIVPISDLLRKNGVLDQLRAEGGVEITSPEN